eukprot:GHVT01000561.1.p1 GENE.GHVT01000561.1~~GHVT01000561.1.p1  ORF type:complete len:228 (+),score=47.26 GHVT01000561.1:263-946(+)
MREARPAEEPGAPPSPPAATRTVLPMGVEVAQQLCSSQVVIDLRTAVKELVDNALDAKATAIEIVLRDSGGESVEVRDNGRGIDASDFEALAQRSTTSKIEKFEELNSNLHTLGFRGEALNSLCNLSEELTVVTRRADDPVGWHLCYDGLGRLKTQEQLQRNVGTTVCCSRLFAALPVRRREFLRSIKAQVASCLQLLQAYAIAYGNVKFFLTNYSEQGARCPTRPI